MEIGETLTITAHVTDAQSGVSTLNAEVYDSYFTYISLCRGAMTQTSGDASDSYWTFACQIPPGTDDIYYDASIYAFDGQNNQAFTTLGFKVNP